jgi:hypothetical protein|tara:strand:- start:2676 stop:3443 length:768 start_codon:yes stop_codon:yes gene_type:complete
MSFNVSKFKSTFERLGGPARPNLFEVTMTNPRRSHSNSFFGTREFSMFCTDVSIPGVAINEVKADYVGQMAKSFPQNVTNPGPITCKFMVDSDHHTLTFFHNWIREVANFSKKNGSFAEYGSKLPHEVGFKSNYSCDLGIKHYSTNGKFFDFYEATCVKAFPISVSPIALSWADNDSFMTVDVSFAIEDIYFSGDKRTSPGSGRGAGLLDILGDVAGFADAVRGTIKDGRPRNIQDAINKLNRVGDAFGSLSNNI